MKTVNVMLLALLLFCTLFLALDIHVVEAFGTIYIRADGSIDPTTAPISTVDSVTYLLIGNITSDANGIVVERSNIVIDGNGYTLEGTGASESNGTDLAGRTNVTVRNTQIRNFQYGVYLSSSFDNSIIGNNITNSYYGVFLRESTDNSIVENNVTNNRVGILFDWSTYNSVVGNNITTCDLVGVSLGDSTSNSISGNNISNNSEGIALWRSAYNSIVENNVTSNGCGTYLSGTYQNILYHNNFVDNTASSNFDDGENIWDDGYLSGGNYWSDYEGVDEKSGPYQNQTGSDRLGDTPNYRLDRYPLMNLWTPTTPTSYVIRVPMDLATIQEAIDVAGVRYTIFVSHGTYSEQLVIRKPLLLIGEQPVTTIIDGGGQGNVISVLSKNVVIQNFTIRNSAGSIYGRLCAGICIDNYGVSLAAYDNALISGNIITNNGGDGIAFYYTTNNTVLGNIITNHVGGRSIFLYGSSNNSISGNNITADTFGIAIQESSNNSISGNNIANNGYGIYFSYLSDCNKFYHNNFIDNTLQVEFHPQSGYTNFCDDGYPSGGNYWSDYNGTEFDAYGIGSEPYIIDANNTDRFPLKNPHMYGDINHDSVVNIVDISIIAKAFGTQSGDTDWNPHADLDENNRVNIVDISKAAKEFGKEWVW